MDTDISTNGETVAVGRNVGSRHAVWDPDDRSRIGPERIEIPITKWARNGDRPRRRTQSHLGSKPAFPPPNGGRCVLDEVQGGNQRNSDSP